MLEIYMWIGQSTTGSITHLHMG